MGKTTDEIRRKIIVKQVKLDRELTEEEKRKIIKDVKRSNRIRRFFTGALLAIGITVGAGGHALLTSGEKEEKIQNEQEIDAKNQTNQFKDGLSVKIPELQVEQAEDAYIKENIENDIDELYSSEEILDYIKEIYINEYNEQNSTDYTIDQLTLYKEREGEKLHRDVALNGDSIIRNGYEEGNYVDTTAGVITATIKTENNIIKQKVVNYSGSYRTVYPKDGEVLKYEDNFLTGIAPILSNGIQWSAEIHNEELTYAQKEEYKNIFINSVVDYKMKQNEKSQENEYDEEIEEHEN